MKVYTVIFSIICELSFPLAGQSVAPVQVNFVTRLSEDSPDLEEEYSSSLELLAQERVIEFENY